MPKKYGVKEKDLVVSHVVTLILTGKLRSGDRIDRNEIADELGLSRVPVQEAMVQLEHDGIVSTRYHRGAFVERFDESTVTEHHQIYGILNGIAATRAARAADPELLERLEVMLRQLRTLSDPMAFQMLTWEYRTAINDAYAGPRLQALIRSSYSFVPRMLWSAYGEVRDDVLAFYEAETEAIRAGDADAVRIINEQSARRLAEIMVTELRRRGVFGNLR
ncbi:GntR family transcriptional regulator [Mycolicibacterium confluentis]|uniref:Putative HTH-type transcriptional regulator n=1 Tax=Mycolicibacterium confluentis TaxID=28047 RepID=A0A7I7Y687_9MYCO|nr:GntR family transcriptional regulator [Mycolicibacterium confluentis]MCV7318932.1 GntR family transcriptional regulator [Mycolicibacterium confluentis]ORV28773.1 GntR family transcriptional regulator [Mycolicibacterium confluentis]BBZ36542.1 putative HTH-type transcriptional regulator [Mycolicibacterium confluentis]